MKDMIADASSNGFADRQLVDTGWAAREARDFLKRLWPDGGTVAPVETMNGHSPHSSAINGASTPSSRGLGQEPRRLIAIMPLTRLRSL